MMMQAPNESSHRVDSSSQLPNSSDHDLYTIPGSSSWFSWDHIHEKEKAALPEFFNGSSISRTPKIYKDYRDFIINKFREDPTRRLTFPDVRKSLVADVSSLHRLFRFLDASGLINFSAAPYPPPLPPPRPAPRLVVEDGPPLGIRVVEFPNSTGALSSSAASSSSEADRGDDVGEGGFCLPPLASYSDVFGEAMLKKRCSCCSANCASGYYELAKQDGSIICANCFKKKNDDESRLEDDYKFIDVGTRSMGIDSWTDTETMLLLEAVMKHGDDWNLVEQHVRTKTKLDCISRLIELPFGENMLRASIVKADGKISYSNMSNAIEHSASSMSNAKEPTVSNMSNAKEHNVKNMINATEHSVGNISNVKQVETSSACEPPGPVKTEDQHHECMDESGAAKQINDDDTSGPPPKRQCVPSFADASNTLMKQVALLSTTLGPHVAAAAAEGSVVALCKENPCARKFYETQKETMTYDQGLLTSNNESARNLEGEDIETQASHEKSDATEAAPDGTAPSTLQVRATIATAFGAAAAHAKLLADQEEREMEYLMATIIEAQLKKIQCKIKHFEELEMIMEKEYSQLRQLKEVILAQRIDVLQRALSMGIMSSKDHNIKPLTDTLL